MKRFSLLLLALLLIMSSTVVYGSIDDKLSNHWSKDQIDRPFLTYYFPYLSKENFNRLAPNKAILKEEFNLSVASLFKEYGYEVSGVGSTGPLSRRDLVSSLGQKLLNIGLKNNNDKALPFKDINTMDSNSIELLRVLYINGIIRGDSNALFSPDRHLSQAEAIIILQRVKGVLEKMEDMRDIEDMEEIPFEILGVIQTFNNQEEIVMTQEGDKVLITVTKEFPTPGYNMVINKITRENGKYKIYFDINPPEPDSVQLQVITYKTITLEVDKKNIGEPPYNFILDGYNRLTNEKIS